MTRKPRVIRRVIKNDSKGRPKRARDRKIGADMERVTARSIRPCSSYKCPHFNEATHGKTGVITPGTEYAKVHANEGRPMHIRGRTVYSPRDYHFDCVPEKYRPLIRFLVSRNPTT